MKTRSEVEPAEMNGNGNPVGGIEPLNTSYCTINLSNKKEQIYCSFFTPRICVKHIVKAKIMPTINPT